MHVTFLKFPNDSFSMILGYSNLRTHFFPGFLKNDNNCARKSEYLKIVENGSIEMFETLICIMLTLILSIIDVSQG